MLTGWNLNIVERPGYFIVGIYLNEEIRGSLEVRNKDELESIKRVFINSRVTGDTSSVPEGLSREDILEIE